MSVTSPAGGLTVETLPYRVERIALQPCRNFLDGAPLPFRQFRFAAHDVPHCDRVTEVSDHLSEYRKMRVPASVLRGLCCRQPDA